MLNGENETIKPKDSRGLPGSAASSGVGSPGSTKVWLSFIAKFYVDVSIFSPSTPLHPLVFLGLTLVAILRNL